MADGIFIDISQFESLAGKISGLKDKLGNVVDDVLNASAKDIEARAIQLAPKNHGAAGLAGSIRADNDKFLEKHITANRFYASFQEFGTGKYAAEYVGSLPATWQEYAATFRGQTGGGTFEQMLKNLFEWVKDKGIAGRYSVKTQRRQKSNKAEVEATKQIAYLIARKILRDGVRPHPFMFPAYEENRPLIEADITTAIKSLFR